MKRAAWLLLLLAGCRSGLELDQGRNYPCAPDAGSAQCSDGYICGLEGRCHAVDAPGAWACNSDAYCATAAGWHCDGVAGKCVDAASEGVAPTGPLSTARVSPSLPTPTRFSVSTYFDYSYGEDLWDAGSLYSDTRSDPDDTYHYGLLADGKVISVLGLFGEQVFYSPWLRQDAPAPEGGANDLATSRLDVYVASPTGVWTRTLSQHPEAWRKLVDGISASRLIRQSGELSNAPELIWAVGGGHYAVIDTSSNSVSTVLTFPDSANIIDIATGFPDDSDTVEFVFALTDKGLYVAPRTESGFVGGAALQPAWTPVNLAGFPNAACGAAPAAEPLELYAGSDDTLRLQLRVLLRDNGADSANPRLLSVHGNPPLSPTSCSDLSLSTLADAPICPSGERYEGMSNLRYAQSLTNAWCSNSAGTHLLEVRALGGQNLWTTMTDEACYGPLDQPAVRAKTRVDNTMIDGYGRIFQDSGASLSASSFLHSPVRMVAGGGFAPLYVEAIPESCGYDGTEKLNTSYVEWAGVGITGIYSGNASICGSVENAPGLYITATSTLDDNGNQLFSVPPHIVVTGLEDAFFPLYDINDTPVGVSAEAPYAQLVGTETLPQNPCDPASPIKISGSSFRSETGVTQLLIAAGDRLFVGPFAKAQDGTPSTLVSRHVVSPGLNIDQVITVSPNAEAGELTAGYVLGGERVFRFFAYNPTRWKSSEIDLPAGEPIAIWKSGASARVGFRNGVVYSLPSRLPLSEPLADPVVSYGSTCGVGYAVSGGKLYRLEGSAGGGVEGAWTEVNVEWGVAPSAPTPTLTHGYVHSTTNGVYVFSDQGVVVKLTGDCP
ncbi:MAG: hypothetical protein ACJ790_12525 [Myxococcaceae bacterium]